MVFQLIMENSQFFYHKRRQHFQQLKHKIVRECHPVPHPKEASVFGSHIIEK